MPAQSDQTMTVVAEFQIRPDRCSMAQWLEVWSARAADAQEGEPQTLSYATAINLEDPNNVLVFERYHHGASSLAAHRERDAHQQLLQQMGDRNMTKGSVMSAAFTDLAGFGFWSRAGSHPTAESRLSLLGLRFPNLAMQEHWIAMVSAHAAYCREQEQPTLIYAAGRVNQDAQREINAKSGDLVVAMLSANEEGIGTHQQDERHQQLQAAFKEEGMERDLVFLRRYRVTGDGYWWR